MNNSDIITEVNGLLNKNELKKIPIKVKIVAHRLGIKVFKECLPDDISGILDLRSVPAIILVNSNHRLYRQRF